MLCAALSVPGSSETVTTAKGEHLTIARILVADHTAPEGVELTAWRSHAERLGAIRMGDLIVITQVRGTYWRDSFGLSTTWRSELIKMCHLSELPSHHLPSNITELRAWAAVGAPHLLETPLREDLTQQSISLTQKSFDQPLISLTGNRYPLTIHLLLISCSSESIIDHTKQLHGMSVALCSEWTQSDKRVYWLPLLPLSVRTRRCQGSKVSERMLFTQQSGHSLASTIHYSPTKTLNISCSKV